VYTTLTKVYLLLYCINKKWFIAIIMNDSLQHIADHFPGSNVDRTGLSFTLVFCPCKFDFRKKDTNLEEGQNMLIVTTVK
jgi:hypothetical protein